MITFGLVWQNFNPLRWASCISTQYTVFWCLFRFCLYDARRGLVKSISCGSLWFLVHTIHSRKEYCLSVPAQNFVLPLSILNWRWSVNWLHIQCDKCIWRNCLELPHCPVMKDQWDCVMNDLEELRGKEFLVLTDQCSIEIFSCCLRLLPSCSSIHHQTNIKSAQICSEDHLSVSRIRSHHLLLEVILHAEEEYLSFLPRGTLDRIELLVQNQSMFLQEKEQSLKMSKQWKVLSVLLWPLIGLQKQMLPSSTQILPSSFQKFPALCRRTLCRSSL